MNKNVLSVALLAGALLLPVAQAAPQQPDSGSPTADHAKNNYSDRQLMKNIRHDLVADKSLSVYGHNVKVIAEHGKVTLKGPVHSGDERKTIEEHARKYAGDGRVDNQIIVQTDRK